MENEEHKKQVEKLVDDLFITFIHWGDQYPEAAQDLIDRMHELYSEDLELTSDDITVAGKRAMAILDRVSELSDKEFEDLVEGVLEK